MTEFNELALYEGLPFPKRCFVLGAGASYDAGVPVESYILDAAKWTAEFLRTRSQNSDYESKAIESIDHILQAVTANGGTFVGPLDPIYQLLNEEQRLLLSRVVVFVLARVGWHATDRTYYYRHGDPRRDDPFSYQRFQSELKPTDVVITFNYDPFLEKGISPPWKVHYGRPISPWPFLERYPIRGKDETNTLRILRLHGSAGWLTCPRCRCTEDFGYMNVYELGISETAVRKIDADAYCPRCMRDMGMSEWGLESMRMHGSDSAYKLFEREHCVILPAATRSYDSEPLRTIWNYSEVALSQCEEVIAIGYSLPPVDVAFRECFERAMQIAKTKPIVTVIDPSETTQATWKEFAVSVGLSVPTQRRCTFSDWLERNKAVAEGGGQS